MEHCIPYHYDTTGQPINLSACRKQIFVSTCGLLLVIDAGGGKRVPGPGGKRMPFPGVFFVVVGFIDMAVFLLSVVSFFLLVLVLLSDPELLLTLSCRGSDVLSCLSSCELDFFSLYEFIESNTPAK